MSEFTTVSASSFDPSALAAKLTDKTAEGWELVTIVPTGGDITAFLTRAGGARDRDDSYETERMAEPAADPTPEPASEPAGWATAPEPAPAYEPTSSYQPSSYQAATPAPSYTPAPAPAAAPSVPAGWYADPAGRFELRYWDGGTWTEHVSRAGQQFTDPPVA